MYLFIENGCLLPFIVARSVQIVKNCSPVGLDVHVHRDPPLRHGSGGVWFDDISEVAVGVGLSSQVFHVETLETLKVDKVSASSAA